MKEKKTDLSIKEALYLFHQDGVIDIIAGATLINFGFDVLNKAETTSLFTWIPILLLSSLKNKNTLPKLEEYIAVVSEKQKRKWTFIPAVGMIIALVILGIMMLGDPLHLSETAFLPVTGDLKSFVGIILLALFCLVPAIWIPLKNFYIYSAVAFAAGIASFFILPDYAAIFITAGVMVVFGARMMIRFAREYTLIEKNASDEN